MKRIVTAFAFLIIMAMLLLFPEQALFYTFTGLTLWFERMVPALFPFMMISQLFISFELFPVFLTLFRPLLGKIFPLPDAGLYCILTGFLCGFPMGAKNATELYRRGQLSLSQAQALLNFCNQIGPVYFVSFAYPILQRICPAFPLSAALLGMYGVPFCFGIWEIAMERENAPVSQRLFISEKVKKNSFDAIVTGNLIAISRLAGYMMFFPVFLVLLEWLPQTIQQTSMFLGLKSLLYLLLEITGGLSFLSYCISEKLLSVTVSPTIFAIIGMGALQFGGLSCLFQTQSMIQGTPLSLKSYLRARFKMTLLCVIFCVAASFCW